MTHMTKFCDKRGSLEKADTEGTRIFCGTMCTGWVSLHASQINVCCLSVLLSFTLLGGERHQMCKHRHARTQHVNVVCSGGLVRGEVQGIGGLKDKCGRLSNTSLPLFCSQGFFFFAQTYVSFSEHAEERTKRKTKVVD